MSRELQHLQRSRVRLATWLMQHDRSKDLAGEMVDEALKMVSKACQIVAENEEEDEEGRKSDGLGSESGMGAEIGDRDGGVPGER